MSKRQTNEVDTLLLLQKQNGGFHDAEVTQLNYNSVTGSLVLELANLRSFDSRGLPHKGLPTLKLFFSGVTIMSRRGSADHVEYSVNRVEISKHPIGSTLRLETVIGSLEFSFRDVGILSGR